MNPPCRDERPRSRWWWWLIGLAGVPLLFATVLHLLPQPVADARLAHLRSLGYPTTLRELAESVPKVPDDQNLSIPLMAAASALRPPQDKIVPFVRDSRSDVERGEAWSDDMLKATRGYVADNAAAFAHIPETLKLQHGDNHLNYSAGFQVLLPQLAQYKALAQALAAKAGLAAEEGRPHDAVQDILGIVADARGLDDEPLLISQLVRIAIEGIACGAAERLVNRVEVAEADLDELQTAFEMRGGPLRLGRNLAGELCAALDFFGQKPGQVFAAVDSLGGTGSGRPGPATIAASHFYSASGLLKRDRATYVCMMADFIDIARMNPWERQGAMARWEGELGDMRRHWYRGRILTGMLLPALANTVTREATGLAKARCAATGLAVERYRRQHSGDSPLSLAELVPSLLGAVPLDPFDGKPLRYEQRGKGYVVYSFGSDGDDDHGRERLKGQGNDDGDVTFTVEK